MDSSNLETIITMNELGLQDSIPQRPKKKIISDNQAKALKELSSNADIVIKLADKGGATVVQNQSDYVVEGLRQLSDQNYYRPLDDNLTEEHNHMVMSNLDTMRCQDEITERAARYLVTEEPRTPQLYLLPKIHKNINPIPGRPQRVWRITTWKQTYSSN